MSNRIERDIINSAVDGSSHRVLFNDVRKDALERGPRWLSRQVGERELAVTEGE